MDTHGLMHFMLFRKSEGYLVYLNEFFFKEIGKLLNVLINRD
jgi:hypothetical protein